MHCPTCPIQQNLIIEKRSCICIMAVVALLQSHKNIFFSEDFEYLKSFGMNKSVFTLFIPPDSLLVRFLFVLIHATTMEPQSLTEKK